MKPPSFLVGEKAPLTKLSQTFPRGAEAIDESLALGLDLGVGSCGQALVYDSVEAKAACKIKGLPEFPNRIAFLGVRAFDVPETRDAKGKIKLKNPERRQKIRLRITTQRRAWRMWEIRKLLKTHGVLPDDYPTDEELWKGNPPRGENPALDRWRDWHSRMTAGQPGVGVASPLELRVKGLDIKLEPLEWAAVLLHIAKHRGFKSNRKAEAAEEEGGKVLKALSANKRRMAEGGFRSVGEMLLKHPDFADRKRNREGVYVATPLRKEQENEIRLLFDRQRSFCNAHATPELEQSYLRLFNAQYPLQNPLNLLGDCPFEEGEKRSPRYAPSFELSRALQKLNNLWVIPPGGGKVRLAEFVDAANGGYKEFISQFGTRGTKSEQGRITWADLREIFDLPRELAFIDLPISKKKSTKGKPRKDGGKAAQIADETEKKPYEPEKEDFVTRNNKNAAAKGTYLLRQALRNGLFDELAKSKSGQLDRAAYALTFFEQIENDATTDKHWGVLNQMRDDALDPRLIEDIAADLRSEKPALAKFVGTTSMSVKACRRLIPHLSWGVVYSEACTTEYGDHRQTDFNFETITNPVVKSVVRECLKQVFHLIDETGKIPGRICVEIGRDLGKSINERNEMAEGMSDRTDARNDNRRNLKDHLEREPDDDELLRYELWIDQNHHCPYCGDYLGRPDQVLSAEFEVDHILPRSRSFDNSYENKVLVHRACNQNKKTATPFEFFGHGDAESEGWRNFTTRLSALKGIRKQKRRNLLNTTFAEDEAKFASRHLNDTRYIAKLVTHYLHALYEMAGKTPVTENGASKYVYVQPGGLTAIVRKAWGLENLKKDVEGNRIGDKHHAVDALICALLSESQRQFVIRWDQKDRDALRHSSIFTEFSRHYRLMEDANDHHRVPGKMDPPWEGFRHDVAAAVNLFTVSRRENRKGRGAFHGDTFYSSPGERFLYVRKKLVDSRRKKKSLVTTKADLAGIKDIDLPINAWLKNALEEWIDAGSPVDRLPRGPKPKPEKLKEGEHPDGPEIFAVKYCSLDNKGKKTRSTFRAVPHGLVVGGDQVRLDVFSKIGKAGKKTFYLVPVYTYHLKQPQPPSLAIVANSEEVDWTPIAEGFDFEFSLWPNSRFLVEKTDGAKVIGNYVSIHRGKGRIEYSNPDDHSENPSSKKRKTPGVAVKDKVKTFQKLYVDRLGRVFMIDAEKRTWGKRTIS